MKTFRVKDFEKFQHYKDRSPPWIKFYNALLDDYDFGALPDATKYHLVAIWLLASRSENKIPYDATWVAARINARSAVDLEALIQSGFILMDQELPTAEHIASTPHAGRLSRGEREAEGKTEAQPDHIEGTRESESSALMVATVTVPLKAPSPDRPIVSEDRKAAVALGMAFINAAGFEDFAHAPSQFYRANDRTPLWIERGWSREMIERETKLIVSKLAPGADLFPLSYFEKVFATAAARDAAPLPIVAVRQSETINVASPRANSRSLSGVLDASIAAAELAERNGRLAEDNGLRVIEGGEVPDRLLSNG